MAEELHRRPNLIRLSRLVLSYSLRQNGRIAEAERVLASAAGDSRLGDANDDDELLGELAATRLMAGDAEAAVSHAERALRQLQRHRLMVDPFVSDLQLTRGQALLQLGRAEEALAAFRVSDEFWRSYDPNSHWAAEASYWLARALIETGDASNGKRMLKSAQAGLAKSPMPAHRALVASTSPTSRAHSRHAFVPPPQRPCGSVGCAAGTRSRRPGDSARSVVDRMSVRAPVPRP